MKSTLKKIALTSSIALFLPTPGGATHNNNKSFRFGVGIGAQYLNLHSSLKTSYPPLAALKDGTTQNHDAKSFNVFPTLEIGKFITDDIYLGLTASFHLTNASSKNVAPLVTTYTLHHELKLHNYFDALIKVGYQVTQQTLAYVKLGPSFAKFSHNTKEFDEHNEVDNLNSHFHSTGLSIGGGLEFPASEHITVSLDYTHTFHMMKKVKKNLSYLQNNMPMGGGGFTTVSDTFTKKITPSYGALSIKATYYF